MTSCVFRTALVVLLFLSSLERFGQFPALVHAHQDIAAAHKLALDEYLHPEAKRQDLAD